MNETRTIRERMAVVLAAALTETVQDSRDVPLEHPDTPHVNVSYQGFSSQRDAIDSVRMTDRFSTVATVGIRPGEGPGDPMVELANRLLALKDSMIAAVLVDGTLRTLADEITPVSGDVGVATDGGERVGQVVVNWTFTYCRDDVLEADDLDDLEQVDGTIEVGEPDTDNVVVRRVFA